LNILKLNKNDVKPVDMWRESGNEDPAFSLTNSTTFFAGS